MLWMVFFASTVVPTTCVKLFGSMSYSRKLVLLGFAVGRLIYGNVEIMPIT